MKYSTFSPSKNYLCVQHHNWRKRAFTLAEVLITLGIIGIVAAMTLPVLLTNVQSQIKEKRIENIKQKLSKATDKMAATSDLRGYASTMAFIRELQKHLKITQICDNDNLRKCWPTEKVETNDGMWEIKDTKTAETLGIDSDNWDNTVGIITADGTSMILSYDLNCNFNPDNGFTFNRQSGLSNSTTCLSGVFDWNGSSKPNKLGEEFDVQTLGLASGLGGTCMFEVANLCIAGQASRMTWDEAMAKGKLFNMSELMTIANSLYTNGSYDLEKARAIGVEDGGCARVLWSNEVDSNGFVLGVSLNGNSPALNYNGKSAMRCALFKGR